MLSLILSHFFLEAYGGDGDPGTMDLSMHAKSPVLSISIGTTDFVLPHSVPNNCQEAQNVFPIVKIRFCLTVVSRRLVKGEPTSSIEGLG